MSETQRHRRARERPRPAVVALAAVAVLACSLAAGALAQGPAAGAGGTESPAAEPPAAAEARAWEEAFLASEPAAKAPLPVTRGKAPGGNLFPRHRMLSLYGAAGGFGILGRKSLNGAGRKLNRQVKPYRERSSEPVVKAFDLVAVIATQCSGGNKCRVRVSDDTIRRYLGKIRELGGRLVLDIQPGRSNVLDEMNHYRKFLRQPDVDVAIDAEWNVGRGGVPGETLGSISARKVNNASALLRKIINNRGLPAKALIVHQFRRDSVRGESNITRPKKVDVTLNFDGIGSPRAKRSGYRSLSYPGLFDGFSLFYELDDNLLSPRQVLGLKPKPGYVMYQ